MTWDPPGPPIRTAVDEWINMHDSRVEPAGGDPPAPVQPVGRLPCRDLGAIPEGRQLVDYFPSLSR